MNYLESCENQELTRNRDEIISLSRVFVIHGQTKFVCIFAGRMSSFCFIESLIIFFITPGAAQKGVSMKNALWLLLTIISVSWSQSQFFNTEATGYQSADLESGLYFNGFDAVDGQIWAFATNKLWKIDTATGIKTDCGVPAFFGSGTFNSFVTVKNPDSVYVGFTKTGNVDDRIFLYTPGSNNWQQVAVFKGNFDCEIVKNRIFVSGLHNSNSSGIWLLSADGNHDLLVATTGFSTGIGADRFGNLYCAGETKLRKFTAAQINSAVGESSLAENSGEILSALEQSTYDTEVDAGENVIINGNGSYSYTALWNGTHSDQINYSLIGIGGGTMGGNWFGMTKVDGNLKLGATLYQADAYYFGLARAVKSTVVKIPQAPVLKVIHQNAVLQFNGSSEIQTAVSTDLNATTPLEWNSSSTVTLANLETVKVFARFNGSSELFSAIYEVKENYPGAAQTATSTAIAMSDSRIKGWADEVVEINYGPNVSAQWKTPEKALGAAVGSSFDVVCLGDGGDIVLKFDPPVINGSGDDFCIFENGFADNFLEFAKVEVSSDGYNFSGFDNCNKGGNSSTNTANIGQLAGKYRQAFGDPWDLETLKNKPEVINNIVDLNNIRFVRVVDVTGDGRVKDSFGNSIYDSYPTSGSGGFDLDAVGVINQESGSEIANIPSSSDLKLACYPNPFNPATTISYQLSAISDVRLMVYNAKGEMVKTLVNGMQNAGKNDVSFDATGLNSGVYFYKLEAGGNYMIKKVVLVK